MINSNLSKIKPKLRTSGRVSGNFGRNKVRAGSSLNDIGVSKAETIRVTTQDEYLKRLYLALDRTTDLKQKRFLITEIKKILIQTNRYRP